MGNENLKCTVGVTMTPQLRNAIDAKAKYVGVTRSEWIRQQLAKQLKVDEPEGRGRPLTVETVNAIRRDTRRYRAIAEEYGVALSTVAGIKTYTTHAGWQYD